MYSTCAIRIHSTCHHCALTPHQYRTNVAAHTPAHGSYVTAKDFARVLKQWNLPDDRATIVALMARCGEAYQGQVLVTEFAEAFTARQEE